MLIIMLIICAHYADDHADYYACYADYRADYYAYYAG